MEQVFINLLENAAKYTPAGSPIEISATARDGEVTVTVADRGPGIPSGDELRIFEKFYRAAAGRHRWRRWDSASPSAAGSCWRTEAASGPSTGRAADAAAVHHSAGRAPASVAAAEDLIEEEAL